MALIANPELSEGRDPLLLALAKACGDSTNTIVHRVGIYEVSHFGSSDSLRDLEHHPVFPNEGQDFRGSYGVCDSVENLLQVYPELEAPVRDFAEPDHRPVTVAMDESTLLPQPSVFIRQQMEKRAQDRTSGYWRSPGFNILKGGS